MEETIKAYKKAAIAHGAGTVEGNSDMANHAYDELHRHLQAISESKQDHLLENLLTDDDVWVQLWSATHLLEINEPSATSKLQEIADASILLASMNARYTLSEWKSGNILFRT